MGWCGSATHPHRQEEGRALCTSQPLGIVWRKNVFQLHGWSRGRAVLQPTRERSPVCERGGGSAALCDRVGKRAGVRSTGGGRFAQPRAYRQADEPQVCQAYVQDQQE